MQKWSSIWKLAAVGIAIAAITPTASAFFPPVEVPAETVTVVVPPVAADPIMVQPVAPVPAVWRPAHQPVEKPAEVPTCTCDNPGPPQSVPEPATLVVMATGLATLAVRKLRKK